MNVNFILAKEQIKVVATVVLVAVHHHWSSRAPNQFQYFVYIHVQIM